MSQDTQYEPSGGPVTIRGTLPKLKPEDARRIAVYLVRANEVIAQAPVDDQGRFRIDVQKGLLQSRGTSFPIEAVIAPAAMGRNYDPSRDLPRIPVDLNKLDVVKRELVLPTDRIDLSDAVLQLWWLWCRNYCVSGIVVGPNGCPVPGAEVTVSNVLHASGGGFTVTPRKTVIADSTGHFTACFEWCSFCYGWPCRPFWWHCWPWWWDWDILRVLEEIEGRLAVQRPPIGPVPPGPLQVQRIGLPLKQPTSADLMIGQGFADPQRFQARLVPDHARTELIRRKFSDARIRALFPWWWWCCENPNILFTVRQGANLIVDEQPATDTRWCFPNHGNVTLVGNEQTITACGNDTHPAHGFVWTRVGNTLVNTIVNGYAQGNPAGNDSDMAFTGTLDIFGEFALASPVAYYQVLAGQWSGNPARGGTPPASTGIPIDDDLYNYAFMLHAGGVVTVEAVKMGPFNHLGHANLYATQESRSAVPAGLLPPFPSGAFIAWGYSGRKVDTAASNLIGGSLGAVTLSVTGFDSAFNPVALPPNTDDTLTLEIDTTGLTAAHINSFQAFNSSGTPVISTGASGACPAFNVGPGGYVVLNVTVRDDNGHLADYELVPNFGHSSTGTTIPDVRGYRSPLPFSPSPAPGPYAEPVIALKSFPGGTENITFYPTVDCCYDFRLNVQKRVTDGNGIVGSYTADFWTATLKVS